MIRIVVDVNLSPSWVPVFGSHSIEAVHWSTVGDVRAADRVVLTWARENVHVLFTHDLDYGAILAHTSANGPSVIQVRAHDVMPEHLEAALIAAIREYEESLLLGAILTIDENRRRVRLLPLASKESS